MKTLLSIAGGAVLLTEEGGVFTLSLDESLSLGGGKSAGILAVKDKGSVIFNGKQAFDLVAAIGEANSPAVAVPIEEAVQAIADVAISNA